MSAKGCLGFRRKHCIWAFVLFILITLVGCGSGTTGSGSGPTWQYAAMGDSLAAGALAQEGYVPRYATYVNIDTGSNVTTLNMGIPGWHSGDLLNALQNDPIFRNQVSGAELVTWDIGGNDLANAHDRFVQKTCGGLDNQDCLRSAVSTFEPNWDAIVAEVLKLRDPSKTILRTMDIYNPYVASDMKAGIFTITEPYLDEVNSHIHANAQANGIPVAAVHQAFNGADGTQDPGTLGLIAGDGFHPNDAGHKVIADQLRTLAYAPLH
jgi:lysophospholipase L1-like esterase